MYDCVQLLPRLQDKKVVVEKECTKLPGAPKAKDIFQLCRGFERAFTITVEVCELLLELLFFLCLQRYRAEQLPDLPEASMLAVLE